jgi:hypothetical protein
MTATEKTAERLDLRTAGLQAILDAIETSTKMGEENGKGFFAYFTQDEQVRDRILDTLDCPHGQASFDLAATMLSQNFRETFRSMAEHATSSDDPKSLEAMVGQFVGLLQHVGAITAIFESTAEFAPDANLIGRHMLRNLLENAQSITKALALKHAAGSDPGLAAQVATDLMFAQDRAADKLDAGVEAAIASANAQAEAQADPKKLN